MQRVRTTCVVQPCMLAPSDHKWSTKQPQTQKLSNDSGGLNPQALRSLTMNMSTPVMIVYEDDMAKLGKYISCFLPPKYWSGKIEAPMPWEASVLGISKRQGGTFACAEVSTEIGGRLDVLGGNEDWVSVENVFEVKAQVRFYTLHPTPYTLIRPTPYPLRFTPYILHPTP
jgi:hypothetical protein